LLYIVHSISLTTTIIDKNAYTREYYSKFTIRGYTTELCNTVIFLETTKLKATKKAKKLAEAAKKDRVYHTISTYNKTLVSSVLYVIENLLCYARPRRRLWPRRPAKKAAAKKAPRRLSRQQKPQKPQKPPRRRTAKQKRYSEDLRQVIST
jgi:hypothetical protein